MTHPNIQHQLGQQQILKRWLPELSQRTRRSIDDITTRGLLEREFQPAGVLLEFKDGSVLRFECATWVEPMVATRATRPSGSIAVFTKNCGYHEFLLGAGDRVGPNRMVFA